MGSSGVDVLMSPKLRVLFPFSPECKNTKQFPSLSALEQSRANKYFKHLAAVIWKPPGKGMDKAIIYFDFNEFLAWWKEIV